ncbi:MAG TPA: cache domain-containing protein [Patescibacteria group bacterium]|nr:cache domain-containing protein [Patescibacteria group bacterium]
MLPLQFFGQNVHFAISLFAALVFFAVFWLYFDAWTASRDNKDLVKCGGFLLVALSFVLHSTLIEQSVLGTSQLGAIADTLATVLRIVGYVGIIIGQLVDPLQDKPQLEGLDTSQFSDTEKAAPPAKSSVANTKKARAVGFGSAANLSHLLLPLSAFTIAGLYWRRATTGLERHLKPLAIAFCFLTGFEVLSLASLWRSTDNPIVARLVAPFGPLWIAEQVFLLIGSVVLGWWVWRYLTRRFLSQLFMVFTTLTLAVFLVTTVSFTFLLVKNVQNESLSNLQTASNVLKYALSAKEAETLANASSVAESSDVVSAVLAKDNKALANLTSTFLHDKKQSSLIITTASGQVLLRAEDPARYGDSLSSDTLVRRALIGEPRSSISAQDGVLAPVVFVRSTTPIRDAAHNIVGTVTVGLEADNAFVDGIKHSTGLDSAVYAGNVRSATTFVAPDGVSRLVGVKDTNASVQSTVLQKGKSFNGSVSILNRQFLAVYAPLKDIDNTVVGMLFIGVPQASILQDAGHSIELTFIVTAILLVLSIVPAFLISKYITKQLD